MATLDPLQDHCISRDKKEKERRKEGQIWLLWTPSKIAVSKKSLREKRRKLERSNMAALDPLYDCRI